MEHTSTNASENSPGIYRQSKGRYAGTEPHVPQCDCEQATRNFFSKTLMSVFSFERTKSCSVALNWVKHCKLPVNAKQMYLDILNSPFDGLSYEQSLHQIELDLNRTYPDERYFSDAGPGQGALRRVLSAFAKYDTQLGYVQGMNFIMGALLWHSTEEDAFWLFVALVEDYELRDNYMPRLPGLSKHAQMLDVLVLEYLPALHFHFTEHRVLVEMYATDWCFSLFGSVVPINELAPIYDKFFREGWIFFYKIVLIILKRLERVLLRQSETGEILSPLKPSHQSQAHCKRFLDSLKVGRESLDWNSLSIRALKVQLDVKHIHYMLKHFNPETAQFCLPARS